ncbi:MAG: hypothetical protein PHS93_07875, partial [Candidatus Omnitrophica bacterium]|nr:hypothetical protein [Candidatus Omnitrophota bacterium]
MCHYRSGEPVFIDETSISLKTLPHNDCHTTIRKKHNIGEDDGSPFHSKHTPVEYVPGEGADLRNPGGKGWELIFDDIKPEWWTDAHTKDTIRQFCDVIRGDWNGDKLEYPGSDLDLSSLTTIPAGVTLSAGSNLNLSRLTTIPAGVTLSAGGYLNLFSLTTIPAGVTLSAGSDLILSRLTT